MMRAVAFKHVVQAVVVGQEVPGLVKRAEVVVGSITSSRTDTPMHPLG